MSWASNERRRVLSPVVLPACPCFDLGYEDKTREQALMTSQMPFIHPHLALMQDAHWVKARPSAV